MDVAPVSAIAWVSAILTLLGVCAVAGLATNGEEADGDKARCDIFEVMIVASSQLSTVYSGIIGAGYEEGAYAETKLRCLFARLP